MLARVPFYTALLLFACARTGLGLVAVARVARGDRPWPLVAQGGAEVCCALLLRTYFDPPFRGTLGWTAWPVFAFALVWSAVVWTRRVWSLTASEEASALSALDAFGLGMSSGLRGVLGVLWHVGFVAPSLICGGFVLFGFAAELPPRP